MQIGVQLIGDDYANTPPAHALAERGIVANVVGYTVYGDYAQPNPPARIVDAVAQRRRRRRGRLGTARRLLRRAAAGAARRRRRCRRRSICRSCRSCSTSRWACAAATSALRDGARSHHRAAARRDRRDPGGVPRAARGRTAASGRPPEVGTSRDQRDGLRCAARRRPRAGARGRDRRLRARAAPVQRGVAGERRAADAERWGSSSPAARRSRSRCRARTTRTPVAISRRASGCYELVQLRRLPRARRRRHGPAADGRAAGSTAASRRTSSPRSCKGGRTACRRSAAGSRAAGLAARRLRAVAERPDAAETPQPQRDDDLFVQEAGVARRRQTGTRRPARRRRP